MAEKTKVEEKSAKRVRFSDDVECVSSLSDYDATDRNSIVNKSEDAAVPPPTASVNTTEVAATSPTTSVNATEVAATSPTTSVNATKSAAMFSSTPSVIYNIYAQKRVRDYDAAKRKRAVVDYIMNQDSNSIVKNTGAAAKFEDIDEAECDQYKIQIPPITEKRDPDVVGLINDTKQMAISSLSADPTNQSAILQDHQYLATAGTSSGINDVERTKRRREIVALYSKRVLKGLLSEKQTSKLNRYLKKKNLGFATADELKTAVFEAWNEVKDDNSYHKRVFRENSKRRHKRHKPTTSKTTHVDKKRSKSKSKKTRHRAVTEQASQASKSKEDVEESKMEFA